LSKELDDWLAQVPNATGDGERYPVMGTRAIIAPHAGYSYSGSTAAYAYKCINTESIKRVFFLGPSHYFYLSGCAVSKCDSYETPLGNLKIDKEVVEELKETNYFTEMDKDTDEEEHSIEMHLPYTYKIFEHKIREITIVPILVGALNEDREIFYGKILAPYLADPENLFIISSDFCHWGSRFDYTYYRASPSSTPQRLLTGTATQLLIPIHESIHALDHEGMRVIESLDYGKFQEYMRRTKNTICGRHPIGVFMCALAEVRKAAEGRVKTVCVEDGVVPEEPVAERKIQRVRFVKYSQSGKVMNERESSVSYGSAFAVIG